jgi:hypothetical protein
MLTQFRSEQSSSADRENTKRELQLLDAKIEAHLDRTRQLNDKISERRKELEVEVAEAEDEDQGNLALLIQEAVKQADISEEGVASPAVMHAQVQAGLTNLTIGDILTEYKSTVFAGMPGSVVGKINLRIGNVTTRGNARSVVGVFPDDVEL